MRAHQSEIQHLLQQRGVIARRDHPHLVGSFDRLLRSGTLCAVLPGVYADPARATTFGTRVLALLTDVPDAVLVGRAAARLTFWPELRVGDVTWCPLAGHPGRGSSSSGGRSRPSWSCTVTGRG